MNALYKVILARVRVVIRFIILIIINTILGYIEFGISALIIIVRLIRLAISF